MRTRMTMMAALMAGMAHTAAHAGQPQQKLTVYLRYTAHIWNDVQFQAKALAGQMFAKIGISLDWGKGEPSGDSAQPPIFIELVSGTPENRKPGALAYAMPFEGAHITVFYDRIETRSNPGMVLAHVMVHEITHLLQRVSRHSNDGVMKAHWTEMDFAAMRMRPLPFAQDDVALIYLGMAQAARTGALTALAVRR
ncbi:MAG TPA: hypothetical protein VKJ01_16920 [Candidatus Solibacter sp.]|nr:hypothetical protein [Candidatus Solibacter sp.]